MRRAYYSPSACLVVFLKDGVAEFSPLAGGFGQFVTEDPEVIAQLDGVEGVFDEAEYLKRSKPVEVRNRILEARSPRRIPERERQLVIRGRRPPSKST